MEGVKSFNYSLSISILSSYFVCFRFLIGTVLLLCPISMAMHWFLRTFVDRFDFTLIFITSLVMH